VTLAERLPSRRAGVLARNGFARLRDLDDAGYGEVVAALELFQAEFLAETRELWGAGFPIPGDALAHFTRQWEFPYAWTNLDAPPARVLDAGSGMTSFPYLLSASGFDVECTDGDGSLGLDGRFEAASARTGLPVRFTASDLTRLPYADASFDAVVCISVLEHTGPARLEVVAELGRVIRAGGRLVLTFDVDLGRDDGLLLEDAAVLLAALSQRFDPAFPLDLRRPPDLLTSDAFLGPGSWRLPPPWRGPSAEFRSIAVLATTWVRHEDR